MIMMMMMTTMAKRFSVLFQVNTQCTFIWLNVGNKPLECDDRNNNVNIFNSVIIIIVEWHEFYDESIAIIVTVFVRGKCVCILNALRLLCTRVK